MMNKRTFYFLRDSVSGKFYTGSGIDLDTFDKAAVYYQRKNAVTKISQYTKEIYNGSWPWTKKYWTNYEGKVKDQFNEVKKYAKLVKERENLVNWGIEIIEAVVEI